MRRLTSLAFVTLLISSCPATIPGTTRPPGPLNIAVPAGWTRTQWEKSSAVELLRTRKTAQGEVHDAHVMITTEKRRSHDEAVERLGQIADEAEAAPAWLAIDGWPALQRRQVVIAPRPSAAGEVGAGPERKLILVTTAVAPGDEVVRLEGSVPQEEGGAPVADEVESIGRAVSFAARPTPGQTELDLQRLRTRQRPTPPMPAAPPAGQLQDRHGPAPGIPAPSGIGGRGELEVAASADGQHVVVAGQFTTTVFSDDGGRTFGASTVNLPAGTGNNGDPAMAVGASGSFYRAILTLPPGGSCAVGVLSSAPGNGAIFNFAGNAVLCPASGNPQCFPDQEHLAADPNPGSMGDQLYVVYRFFTGVFGGNCPTANLNFPTPNIVCSRDGGLTWTSPTPVGGGDDARVTVGGDGSVWVVWRAGGSIAVNKFSSCDSGLVQQTGFPKNLVNVADPRCPVAGLDRCDGPSLSSATAAVDRTDPNHVFIAYANATSSTNEDIVVIDTSDGFATWPAKGRAVTVNGSPVGRRFMPWICTLGSSAHVAWYDRRSAGPTTGDSTGYFRGSATLSGGVLVSGPEVNVSLVTDAQCAPGFPCGERNATDADSCPSSPQFDGKCRNSGGGGTGAPCDQDAPACIMAGETCVANGSNQGCPKYGDYNGIACAAGHVFAAWASATPPMGLPPPSGIGVFVDAIPCGGPGQACCSTGSACVTGLACSGGTCSPVACGDVGQPCCTGGTACASGSGCLTGTCFACPPAPRTLIDSAAHNGSDCGGTSHDYDFGPATCDSGFRMSTCSATLISEDNGSTCSATALGGCRCRVHVTTPADCTKWATCRVIVRETSTSPRPAGCP